KTDSELTNPVSNVHTRTHVTLRRLDSCVLSWNTRTESLNTADRAVQSVTDTVDLRRMMPEDIRPVVGKVGFSNNQTHDAVTESIVVQRNYAYQMQWQQWHPLFAQMQAPTLAEANALVPILRNLVNSCRAH